MTAQQLLHSYLLIDGAQVNNLAARIYALEESPSLHLLYQQSAYEALADVGPLLVAVRPHSELAQVFQQEWQATAGIWLESDADEDDLVEHLRSLIHVRLEGDQTTLFRYYDPRVMTLWLGVLTAVERDPLMGPVKRIRLPSDSGAELELLRESKPQTFARYDDRPWLHISQAQLEHMNQAKFACFDQRLLAHLQRFYPESLQSMDAAAQQQFAALCRQSAGRYGYTAADEVARWAGLLIELGGDFPQAPEQHSYRQLLEQRGPLPAQRLDNLIAELQRQLLRTDKESVA
ncbi:DUF4123 domain-containing protein [Stutzerimonas nitrititolerans]|uniref:DUF4123 domain-containing protein n=1 Tax=Stutzerimonas nitrititolerans TaxID=2482751 RepID=UPI00289D5492|nr:DUF4123 domain-containing protein [Stutzerimonas nitrititolerans]